MAAKRIYYKNEKLDLVCEWTGCNEAFNDVEDLMKHVSGHVPEELTDDESCQWINCDCDLYEFQSSQDLLRHVLFHAFHSKIKCLGKNLLDRDANLEECNLDTSTRNVIPDLPQSFLCRWLDCEETFNNAEHFYRHVNDHVMSFKEKKGARNLYCKWRYCEAKPFKELEKLRSHLRSHTQEKMIACPICGCFFANRTKFINHIKRQVSTDKAKYQCLCCGKFFMFERFLKDHMRTHVYKFKCMFCDFIASSMFNVNMHIKQRHTDYREYKCSECNAKFKTAAILKRHQDLHFVKREYECNEPDCNFKVQTYNRLRNHLLTVHQGKCKANYACHLCDKFFASGSNLSKHLKTTHKLKPQQTRFRYKKCDDGFYRMISIEYKIAYSSEHNNLGELTQQNPPTISTIPTAPDSEPSVEDNNDSTLYLLSS